MTTTPTEDGLCPYSEVRDNQIYRCQSRYQHYGNHDPVPTGVAPTKCPTCGHEIISRDETRGAERCVYCPPDKNLQTESVAQA